GQLPGEVVELFVVDEVKAVSLGHIGQAVKRGQCAVRLAGDNAAALPWRFGAGMLVNRFAVFSAQSERVHAAAPPAIAGTMPTSSPSFTAVAGPCSLRTF